MSDPVCLHHLLALCDEPTVLRILSRRDGRNLKGYAHVLGELKRTEAMPNTMVIEIYHHVDDMDDSDSNDKTDPDMDMGHIVRHGVHGIDPDDPAERYGLEFSPWGEWLGMEISQLTIDTYTKEYIVAVCIHEMTFYGFSNDDVQKNVEELHADIDKAEASGFEGSKTIEQVKAELGIEDE